MTAVPFPGSPTVPTVANPEKPPASPEDIQRTWASWVELDPSEPAMAAFLDERKLDAEVGKRLGFRQKGIDTTTYLGLNLGEGVKRRSLPLGNDTTRRAVEPTHRKVSWSGVAVIPGTDSPTRAGTVAAETVILCESETDLWAIAQLAPEVDVALMPAGARSWREEWASRLVCYERVLIATDDDESGDLGARKIALDVPQALRLRPIDDCKDWCEVLSKGLIDSEIFGHLVAEAFEPIQNPRFDRDRITSALTRLSGQTGLPLNARGLIAIASHELKLPQEFVRAIADEIAYPPPTVGAWTGRAVLDAPIPAQKPEIFGNGQWVEGEILGIAGQAGVGKTLLALQAGLSLALGLPYFLCDEIPIPQERRVLYIAGEGASYSFAERFRLLSAAAGSFEGSGSLDNFHALGPTDVRSAALGGPGGGIGLKLDLATHLALLLPQIDAISPEVVILDPVRALHGKDENDSQEMEEFFFLLRDRLVRERGLSLLMTHHLRKGAALDANAARGGSWQENVATSWLLAHAGRVGDLTLRATKTRNGAPLRDHTIERDAETLWARATPAAPSAGDFRLIADKIASRLSEKHVGFSLAWTRLMEKEGFKEKRAKALRQHLEGDGRFEFFRDDAVGKPLRLRLLLSRPTST